MAQTAAALTQSGASAEFARQEATRFGGLVGSGAVSLKQAQQAQSEQKRANAAVAESVAMQDQAGKQIAVLESARAKADAMLKRAEAGRDQAKLRLSYTALTAPIGGAVGDRSVRVAFPCVRAAPRASISNARTRMPSATSTHDSALAAGERFYERYGLVDYQTMFWALAESTEPRVGMLAFMEKRAPSWVPEEFA